MPAPLSSPRAVRLLLALALAVLTAAFWPGSVRSQEPEFFDVPWAHNQWTFGTPLDMSHLRYCVDPRDPDWEVAAAIADTIARGLLLAPQRYVVETDVAVTEDITRIYAIMLQHCDLHMGFKLIPEGYESWISLTRAYYQSQYVFVAADRSITALGDVPRTRPIGVTIGTSAHLGLLSYLRTHPDAQRWPIFPMGNDDLALEALLNGTVDVALVWAPTLWARQRAEPAYAALEAISPNPVQPVGFGVGALMLAGQSFLRSAVDEAIAALIADGTIGEILEYYGFPATARP
ncbi:MAG: transporter substrate-binding domain-containing protein [Bauldia sp.]|nr:transporter substrate-binding domain-containing protein [Bauldia sp.]